MYPTSIRRISDNSTSGSSKITSSPRFTLPPISTTSHTPTPLPPLSQDMMKVESNTSGFYPFENKKSTFQKSTFSYSYPPTETEVVQQPQQQQQHEEYYYPVYNKHEWTEVDESLIPVVENSKIKKKREMDERIQEIDREFLDNREVLYGEKIKQLQDELMAVEKGRHETFDQSIADLEQKRRETIHDARLMMIYQISTVDQQCNLNSKKVHDESLAEQKEIQNALFTIIEEKRKKLKEDKDGEGDLMGNTQPHQTRNRKRLLRKRGELEAITCIGNHSPLNAAATPTTNGKRKQDRQKDNPSHLMGVLTQRVEEDIEADYYEMTRKL